MNWRGKTFWEKVAEDAAGCWIWQGRLVKGYGAHAGRLAHRISYMEMVSEIPASLEIDHLCRVTACVNPYHLEPVTRAENARRRFALMTHCTNGHEFSQANTHISTRGYRICRACGAAAQRRRARRLRMAVTS